MNLKRIAVVGAGNGGHAMAADLTLAGISVNLFEFVEFADNLQPIRRAGGVEISGVARKGFAKLNLATTNLEEAIDGVSHIMVVTQSLAHERLAQELTKKLQERQVICIFTGSGGGMIFVNHLDEEIRDKNLTIVETTTLPYACRVNSPGSVRVSRIIKGLYSGVFPAYKTQDALRPLKEVYDLWPAEHILEVAFYNPNVMLHPIASLLNIGHIEYSQGEFYIYREGFTPAILKTMEAFDRERMAVLKKLGLKPMSFDQHFKRRYGKSLEEFLIMMQPLGSKGPFSSTHRYITEDVPIGMVLTATMGRELGVPTPILDGIINLCCAINETNYWETGRTAQSLGLFDRDLNELVSYLIDG